MEIEDSSRDSRIEGYLVVIKGENQKYRNFIESTETTLEIPNLEPTTTYSIYVQVRTALGLGMESEKVQIKTGLDPTVIPVEPVEPVTPVPPEKEDSSLTKTYFTTLGIVILLVALTIMGISLFLKKRLARTRLLV